MSTNHEGAISQKEIDDLLAGVPSEPTPEQATEKEKKEQAKQKAKKNIQKRINSNTSERSSHKPHNNEVLSQDEIDRLLAAISSGNSSSKPSSTPSDSRKIKIYDFKRPDRFSKEQLRFISNANESVSRKLTNYLSNILQTLVHVHVASVDQLTFEEFIRSIPTPSTLCSTVWDIENTQDCTQELSGKYSTICEIDPAITMEILHGQAVEDIKEKLSEYDFEEPFSIYRHRSLTYFEQESLKNQVFSAIYSILAESLNEEGANRRMFAGFNPSKNTPVYKLKQPDVNKFVMENNPQFAQIVMPTEMVMLITLEMKIRDEEGMMNICLPYPFVRDILIKGNILMTRSNTTNHGFGLQVLPGNATTSLGDFNVPEGAKLSEGMIIELPKLAGEPIDLIDKKTGKIFAIGEVIVIDENFGVRVTEVLDKSMEDTSEESK